MWVEILSENEGVEAVFLVSVFVFRDYDVEG